MRGFVWSFATMRDAVSTAIRELGISPGKVDARTRMIVARYAAVDLVLATPGEITQSLLRTLADFAEVLLADDAKEALPGVDLALLDPAFAARVLEVVRALGSARTIRAKLFRAPHTHSPATPKPGRARAVQLTIDGGAIVCLYPNGAAAVLGRVIDRATPRDVLTRLCWDLEP